ncbi:MAG: NAD(P)/FAD-dependent oxidoreductase [Anaerolineae bacterium]
MPLRCRRCRSRQPCRYAAYPAISAEAVLEALTCLAAHQRRSRFQLCRGDGGWRTPQRDRWRQWSRDSHRDSYFCGEIRDVDGRIGGYNFQWAWSSGYVAGCAAGAAAVSAQP